ncbi:MAG: fluoride efflux transporter CrcB [bacterium]
MNPYFLIFVGGGLGACLRFFLSMLIHNNTNGIFPWGTFAINIAGSFILGLVVALSISKPPIIDNNIKLLLTTGFCGGFTTFSTFSWEVLTLLKEGYYLQGFLYSFGSLFIGLIAVFLACWLVRLA